MWFHGVINWPFPFGLHWFSFRSSLLTSLSDGKIFHGLNNFFGIVRTSCVLHTAVLWICIPLTGLSGFVSSWTCDFHHLFLCWILHLPSQVCLVSYPVEHVISTTFFLCVQYCSCCFFSFFFSLVKYTEGAPSSASVCVCVRESTAGLFLLFLFLSSSIHHNNLFLSRQHFEVTDSQKPLMVFHLMGTDKKGGLSTTWSTYRYFHKDTDIFRVHAVMWLIPVSILDLLEKMI